MSIVGIILFALIGAVLGDGGITVGDKPGHFITLLILMFLVEYNARNIGKHEKESDGK